MKSEYINPFIDATRETYETMCGVIPTRSGKLGMRSGMFATDELVGIVGLSGQVRGAILMTMPLSLGQKVVGAFLGEEITDVDNDLMDGFGEIVNIIAGSAAAKLSGFKVNLALPTVMTGKDQKMNGKSSAPWVVIPMTIADWGKFTIEVTMEEV